MCPCLTLLEQERSATSRFTKWSDLSLRTLADGTTQWPRVNWNTLHERNVGLLGVKAPAAINRGLAPQDCFVHFLGQQSSERRRANDRTNQPAIVPLTASVH